MKLNLWRIETNSWGRVKFNDDIIETSFLAGIKPFKMAWSSTNKLEAVPMKPENPSNQLPRLLLTMPLKPNLLESLKQLPSTLILIEFSIGGDQRKHIELV
jgi:hypothetical protein